MIAAHAVKYNSLLSRSSQLPGTPELFAGGKDSYSYSGVGGDGGFEHSGDGVGDKENVIESKLALSD
jgi:hypothetical protein